MAQDGIGVADQHQISLGDLLRQCIDVGLEPLLGLCEPVERSHLDRHRGVGVSRSGEVAALFPVFDVLLVPLAARVLHAATDPVHHPLHGVIPRCADGGGLVAGGGVPRLDAEFG